MLMPFGNHKIGLWEGQGEAVVERGRMGERAATETAVDMLRQAFVTWTRTLGFRLSMRGSIEQF